ncbi:MAG: formate dehydrogenase accessory protein FdhE [Desulfuromonadales bacterium]|nr:MAG: formate dehydrogenase accessory protein FdhE [Desulfuromonadales bacterium]
MPKTAEKLAFLEQTAREAPEYAEVLTVFQDIFSWMEGKEGETGIAFEPSLEHPAERLQGGFPLLTPESLRVDEAKAAAFLVAVVEAMRNAGREADKELLRLKSLLSDGVLDLPKLFAACLKRERRGVAETAEAVGVPAPILEFVLESGLKTALEGFAEGVDRESFAGWKEAYCPVCGSRPGMAELSGEEGKRFLSCSACYCTWPYSRIKCPYCGNEESDSLTYFEAGDGPTRVDVCLKCTRYIKTRDARKGHAEVPMEAEDLTTIHLDLLATREGYERGK